MRGEITEILRTVVGSQCHGTSLPDAQPDRDEMGIAVEPWSCITGLETFEQKVVRTAAEGEPSGPDDTDLTIYGLKKWMKLACQGNPSILVPMFAPDDLILTKSNWAAVEIRISGPEWIASRQAIPRFRGYMRSQAMRLCGTTGRKHGARAGNRPELVEKYGYDTKFAMHMVRLGLEGKEYAETGYITLPLKPYERGICLDIRQGKMTADEALEIAFDLDAILNELEDTSPLPAEPCYQIIEEFLRDTYDYFAA